MMNFYDTGYFLKTAKTMREHLSRLSLYDTYKNCRKAIYFFCDGGNF